MSHSCRQLVLCPQDPYWIPAESKTQFNIEETLYAVALIGARIDAGRTDRFYIGEQFLRHISFMGCAPTVEFMPNQKPDTERQLDRPDFIFVHIATTLVEPGWYADLSMAKPQCPICNKRTALTQDPAQVCLDKNKGQFVCPHCQQSSPAGNLDWREFGGSARVMVSIVNVYPKEALPTDNLLLQLEEQTQIAWRYFYYYGPLINVKS